MGRIDNIGKILDFLMKKKVAGQLSVVTCQKEISEGTGIDILNVNRTINQLKETEIIWHCERCWTKFDCFLDSRKPELNLVKLFLSQRKIDEFFNNKFKKSIKHVPYHIEEFNNNIVLVEVYKSHTTSSVYVKYYNKMTWKCATVRFADHQSSVFDRGIYMTSREEIISYLQLKAA